MKFYNRTLELEELNRIQKLSFEENSRLTVVTGRRRIGKTSLITKALKNQITVYLFVSRKSEGILCKNFAATIESSLGEKIAGELNDFNSIFLYLMQLGTRKSFNLVIDEFQEFYKVNPSIYSDMQNIWDAYRKQSHVNLIVCGSIYSLMHKIFFDKEEPLFGRADNIIKLSTFSIEVLKQIMQDYSPKYHNDDLLALYAFTGGVPKYVELFCDNHALTKDQMIEFMIRDNSPFIEEGSFLLIEEFGKNFGIYFSVLSAISSGFNTQSQIEQLIGVSSVGGYLIKLTEDYNLIHKQRPVMAKPNSLTVRYTIEDNFLRFWFKYIDKNRSIIELKNYVGLREIIKEDYATYSGLILEKYFILKLAATHKYREIGSWWTSKSEQNEIDIVAIELKGKKALVAEVKRQKKNFKPQLLAEKVQHLANKTLPHYSIETTCYTLDDM